MEIERERQRDGEGELERERERDRRREGGKEKEMRDTWKAINIFNKCPSQRDVNNNLGINRVAVSTIGHPHCFLDLYNLL